MGAAGARSVRISVWQCPLDVRVVLLVHEEERYHMEVLMCLAACCTIVGFILDRIEANRRMKGGDQEDGAREK